MLVLFFLQHDLYFFNFSSCMLNLSALQFLSMTVSLLDFINFWIYKLKLLGESSYDLISISNFSVVLLFQTD